MNKLLLSLIAGLTVLSVSAAELEWLTDLPKAQAKAKEEKKIVLINFTGTDWCPFCVKLDKEVLKTKEFADFAKESAVLMIADFPRKTTQPAELKKANQALQKKYGVEGFPTLVVVDSEGKKLGEQVGYGGGGPKAVIAGLKKYTGK